MMADNSKDQFGIFFGSGEELTVLFRVTGCVSRKRFLRPEIYVKCFPGRHSDD